MGTRGYLMDLSMEHVEEEEQLRIIQSMKERLSDARQKKAETYRCREDQVLSLGVGLLLDRGLREYGLREKDVILGTVGNGKPVLSEYPEIHFNLSHSGTMAMAVFSEREVGCDVEREREARLPLAKRFFCQEEYESLARLPEGAEQNHRFVRYWTLKESFLKMSGEGLRLPMNRFRFHLSDPVWVQSDGARLPCAFRELSIPGYCAAVCMAGEEDEKTNVTWFFTDVTGFFL